MATVTICLFRRETIDNPQLGVIAYHYRFGRRAEITADTNRDGQINFRALIDELGLPEEYWEDSDHDGHFDRHVVMDGSQIRRVGFDENEDGEYERYLSGSEARDFYTESEGVRALVEEIHAR
jgi:hypothetical protein